MRTLDTYTVAPDVLLDEHTNPEFAQGDFYAMEISDVERLSEDSYKVTGTVDMNITLDVYGPEAGMVGTANKRKAEYILDGDTLTGGVEEKEYDLYTGNAQSLREAQEDIKGDIAGPMRNAAERFLQTKEKEQAKEKSGWQPSDAPGWQPKENDKTSEKEDRER